MKRGEIYTVSGAGGYAGKPRPVVIVQSDLFAGTDSITICGFTTTATEASHFRLLVEPSEENGLRLRSRIMADKLTTVSRSKLGTLVGHLGDDDMARLGVAMIVFLGLAESSRTRTT